jgi:hypothetical protein
VVRSQVNRGNAYSRCPSTTTDTQGAADLMTSEHLKLLAVDITGSPICVLRSRRQVKSEKHGSTCLQAVASGSRQTCPIWEESDQYHAIITSCTTVPSNVENTAARTENVATSRGIFNQTRFCLFMRVQRQRDRPLQGRRLARRA